jgi:SAM-dependent methyltransferase
MDMFPKQGAKRRVLDVGCGEGHLAMRLAKRGYQVTGVESPGQCGDSFPSCVRLIAGDIEDPAIELDGPYEYVLCADVLEHLCDPMKVLLRMRCLLTANGTLIASLPNSGNIYFRANVLAGRFPKDDRGLFDRTHLHFFTWNGWVDLFRRGGFQVDQVKPTGIPIGLALSDWEQSWPVRLAEMACYHAARVWKKLFAYQFVVAARVMRNGQ